MPHSNQITILVNNKPFHLDDNKVAPEQLRALVDLPADYEVWKHQQRVRLRSPSRVDG